MKNQKGKRVKVDIFGIFDKHFSAHAPKTIFQNKIAAKPQRT